MAGYKIFIGFVLLQFMCVGANNTAVKPSLKEVYVVSEKVKHRLIEAVKHESPYISEGRPTEVRIQIEIYTMDSLSESTMDYSLTVYLRLYWSDERLNFENETMVSDIIQLDQLDIEDMWVPDIFFVNEKSGFKESELKNKLFHIHKNGSVFYSVRFEVTLICRMDLRKYPLDVQKCPIIIESYGQTTEHIIFRWKGAENESLITHNELAISHFTLSGVEIKENINYYPQYGNYSGIDANITLSRDRSYYIIQIYLPSLLVVVLSWVSFWLDIHATPARISLGVLTILTLSTQASGIRPTLPKVSYIKALDVWLAVCMAFVFVALLEYAVVNMFTRGESITTMKQQFVSMRRKKQAKHRDVETGDKALNDDADNCHECHISPATKKRLLNKAQLIDNVSRAVFPIVFIIFNIGYWAFYTQKDHEIELD